MYVYMVETTEQMDKEYYSLDGKILCMQILH